MLAISLLLAASALPPVIADPRQGVSSWAFVGASAPLPEGGASGYLVELPPAPGQVDQVWLERTVALASRGAPVVALGSTPPPDLVLPHIDGVCLDPAPDLASVSDVAGRLQGVPLVLAGTDIAHAVQLLAAGAAAVLISDPAPAWAAAVTGLLPEPVAARTARGALPTALRGADLAAIIGLPYGFTGGDVTLPGPWYGTVTLIGEHEQVLPIRRASGVASVAVGVLARGGLLVAARQRDSANAFEQVAVSGERLPTAEEVLARHQRVASRSDLLVPRWQAEQRLLVRVFVAELGRSFEVVFAGPVFWEKDGGADWEIARAWVDGVAWDPDALPDLPLLEPKRPPAPPLALRLQSTYRYELVGLDDRGGRRCYSLRFVGQLGTDPATRRGMAFIDAATFALVELVETAEGLSGEVRSTHSVTTFAPVAAAEEKVWLPVRVVADDLMSVFGGAATVHRELTISGLSPVPEGFAAARAQAYARPHRMLRDTQRGVAPLVPDGRGGRIVGDNLRPAQRFIIGGAVYDPGLSFPVPFGGFQIQDFRFRGRDQQLRLLLAGAINDGVFVARHGAFELSARAFLQLLAFASFPSVQGEEQNGEEFKTLRQRVGGGIATSVGPIRIGLDLGLDRWDFSRTDNTAPSFVLPSDTWEGVARLETTASLGATTVSVTGEAGRRKDWQAWGLDTSQAPESSWQRARLAVGWEKAPYPLARVRLGADVWTGRNLDRFSAPAPARFGGIRLRGIASGRVLPERLISVSASFSSPLTAKLRGEIGIDAAWAKEERSGYENRPLCGIGIGFTAPGPWGTLVQGSLGAPLVTPGARRPTFELFILKPLGRKKP